MEFIIILAYIVGAILSITLFFKVWGMCNNVSAIRKKIEANEVSSAELTLLASINDPSFEKTLTKAILNSFLSIARDKDYAEWQEVYEARYKWWVDLCQERGWKFPEMFADKKTHKEFRDYFVK
jgi:hypothetical protein